MSNDEKPVVMTGADIICTVEGCGKPATLRVLPHAFQRVMLCDDHYQKISGSGPAEEEIESEK